MKVQVAFLVDENFLNKYLIKKQGVETCLFETEASEEFWIVI